MNTCGLKSWFLLLCVLAATALASPYGRFLVSVLYTHSVRCGYIMNNSCYGVTIFLTSEYHTLLDKIGLC